MRIALLLFGLFLIAFLPVPGLDAAASVAPDCGAPGHDALLAMPSAPVADADADAGLPAGLAVVGDGAAAADVWTDDAPPGGPEPDNAGLPCQSTIRPGARMTSPAGCTMNWVFKDGAGALYIGTAGHCVALGSTVHVQNVGAIGVVVYRESGGVGRDFALIQIDPAVYDRVDPTLCQWGGPVDAGTASAGEPLLVYGHGVVYGQNPVTRGRAAVEPSYSGSSFIYFGASGGGDSGMPIMTADGSAAAIHTHTSGGLHSAIPRTKYGTAIGWAMGEASAAIGSQLELVPGTKALTVPV